MLLFSALESHKASNTIKPILRKIFIKTKLAEHQLLSLPNTFLTLLQTKQSFLIPITLAKFRAEK